MSLPDWSEAPLARQHDRKAFDCGEPALNEYLARFARQNHESGGAKTFIASPVDEPSRVLGYYTLCPTGLSQGDVSAAARKHVPRYPLVSATLVGRLAVSTARQGEGLGALLLADAVRRAYASASIIGSSMLVVDAINERAAAFYEGNGFVRLPESMRLVLPMHVIERMMRPYGHTRRHGRGEHGC